MNLVWTKERAHTPTDELVNKPPKQASARTLRKHKTQKEQEEPKASLAQAGSGCWLQGKKVSF